MGRRHDPEPSNSAGRSTVSARQRNRHIIKRLRTEPQPWPRKLSEHSQYLWGKTGATLSPPMSAPVHSL